MFRGGTFVQKQTKELTKLGGVMNKTSTEIFIQKKLFDGRRFKNMN
ncbi:hypothetical protein pah_c016o100 [Parachlamydia acanthamoebae str. Hall's coccus]|nr:hypothetical protein pah_c016o100 [Parachlamydia acanthamoebae str. Hall's coccus]